MTTQQILQMIAEVEDYIYRKKAVRVKIDPVQIFSNFDQLQKLIYAHGFTRAS
jgi:hypothetical protein